MNFSKASEAYRYFAVTGFECEEQQDYLRTHTVEEMGLDGFMEFMVKISKEIETGVFLSEPPRFVNASEN